MLADTDNQVSLNTVPNKGHCIDCPSVRGGVLQALTGESVQECAFDTLALEPRDALSLDNIPRGSLVLVRRGVLVRGRSDHSGHPTWIDAVGPGGSFVLSEHPSRARIYAVDRTLYCTISQTDLARRLGPSEQGLGELHDVHGRATYRLERFSDARGRANVRARVAATLCTLADTLSAAKGRRIELPAALLQRDIAGLASTRHESVCRILREFSDRGWVEHGPDGIRIVHYEPLAEL